MKTKSVKLSKTEAITIGRLSLIECITERIGIWTFLNERLQRGHRVGGARRLKLGKRTKQKASSDRCR